jgi:outer membrane receptor protein involved in Fe transport
MKDVNARRFPELLRRLQSLAMTIILLPAWSAIHAQQGDANAIEEILVTAQKRTQSLQDVAMSVTAISEHTLERLSADDLADYVGTVPGLSFQAISPAGGQHGQRLLNLRGIAADTGADTVGFYVNETPIQFVDPKIFDVNRIEVLRGPQGTLYGASSMGGTIRIITNEPDFSGFSAKIDGSASTTHHGSESTSISAVMNVPLLENRLALRVVGFNRDEGGYVDNIVRPTQNPASPTVPDPVNRGASDIDEDFNSEDTMGGRVSLRFAPTDDLTITPSVIHQNLELGGDPQYKVILDASNPAFQVGSIAPLADLFTHDDLVTHQPNSAEQQEKHTIYDLTVLYDFGNFSFLSSTSYFERSKSGILDMSIILPSFFGPDARVRNNLDDFDESDGLTEEVRITYNAGGKFEFLLGGFYQDLDSRFKQSLVDTEFNDIVFGGFPVVPNGIFLAFDSRENTEQVAVFGDATYHLLPSLHLTVGLRWFDLDLSTHTVADGLFNGGPTDETSGASESGVNPRFLVSYDFNDDLMTYALVSKGFRPGFGLFPVGVTCNDRLEELGLPLNRTQVDSDSLWNYELGMKSSFFDNRVNLNVAIYRIDWSDIQQSISLGDCGFSTTVNGGEARSEGFEAEVAAVPIEGVELSAGVSYVDARLTEDAPNLGAADGDPILRVSDWLFNVSGTYSFPINAEFSAYVRADYQYTGEAQNGYDFSTPVIDFTNSRPSFDVFNVRAAVLYGDWEVALFGQNLFDERPRIGAVNFISPDINIFTLRPRTFGVNIKKSF